MNIKQAPLKVTLLPNTARLKQLRKEFGVTWITLTVPEPMQCFDGNIGVRIKSLDGTHVRNVKLTDIEVVQ